MTDEQFLKAMHIAPDSIPEPARSDEDGPQAFEFSAYALPDGLLAIARNDLMTMVAANHSLFCELAKTREQLATAEKLGAAEKSTRVAWERGFWVLWAIGAGVVLAGFAQAVIQ